MLLNLHVKNFALIDEAELDFGRGLNVLTGETGAGKSILIDAVNAALGGRVRGDVIRTGADFAYVELVFSIEDEAKRKTLEEMDVSTEYDCILISRKITENRSVHKINDETVTSARVRQVTELLLDIHGQHEHQSLLKKQKHLEILDQFASQEAAQAKAKVEKSYRQWQALKKYLNEFQLDPEARKREMDFLSFEIEEIENAALREGESEELEAEFRRFRNSRRLAEAVRDTGRELGIEGLDGAAEKVSRALRELHPAVALDSVLEGIYSQLSDVEELLGNACRELSSYADELFFDPEEFRRIENRLDVIHRLEEKYGGSYEAIRASFDQKKSKLDELKDFEARKLRAEEEEIHAREELTKVSKELSEIRRRAAAPLAESIRSALVDLNFLNVEFQIGFEPLEEFTKNGQDSVEFLISTNPGEPVRPLGQVASGGELSRIMLAIKALLSDKDEIPTLIFDEIDTGISGRTAQKVSEKLNTIGRNRQVICITHLPQIAAMADWHFCIEKGIAGRQTQTFVRVLNEAESVDELARLLGGAEITDTVRKSAHEMKDLAGRTKNN
ncbi:DNA repair protein RecN [Cuneatibacter sp. NSJ-177]|uniref:DNA repair protein RecN n=1 Tax=Cuneatibacter sp. NSJ-177 TaxID=2931401 RepID=UPI001FD4FEF9|nr:DNA repair protein RecN [Cuneatibacter sp. NSJ-177]MCJ7836315.1 DNA repair protein RecN [Cuneatibacter sp. NSJ-177]